MKYFLQQAMHKSIMLRATKVSLVVGTILAIINHYDAIIQGTFTVVNMFQIVLTYFVPYAVATYSIVSHMKYHNQKEFSK